MTDRDKRWNILAAILSFFCPGLGQLVQLRPLEAICFFLATILLWWIFLGWIIHLWSMLDAAFYEEASK